MSHHCVCHLRWSAQDTIHYNWHVLANCVYLDTYLITSNGRKENHKCDAYVYIYIHMNPKPLKGKVCLLTFLTMISWPSHHPRLGARGLMAHGS